MQPTPAAGAFLLCATLPRPSRGKGVPTKAPDFAASKVDVST
ncbi:MAG TPA: hypothetical protein VHE61_21900 [Opitutaceae bacterium]|nr:hypothetical protein [Opitutaceae bacterium]